MKTARILLRVASALLVLNGVALSIAHVYRDEMATPSARQVLDTMAQPVDFDGAPMVYLTLYTGMTLNLIVMYAFLAVLLWLLSTALGRAGFPLRPLLLLTALFLAVNSALCFRYAFPPPGVMQGLACAFCLYAYVRVKAVPG